MKSSINSIHYIIPDSHISCTSFVTFHSQSYNQ
ncbi:hypothetical protein F383_35224 [Gossypium arboreum]|uniref:Uncharacterized protein n=1 Tax=Gossypium arboreum TaxID=29729 RepID=A0A0B0PXF2_GOSAR|nr:hypothetical protein F383_35224 [Gossypium arboreum]